LLSNIKMATEAVRMDMYYHHAPTLHYVTSADDVIHHYNGRPTVPGDRGAVDRRGAWSSYRDHRDSVPRQPMSRHAGATSNSSSRAVRGDVSYYRRKLSDDGSTRPGGATAGGVAWRPRPLPTSVSDDAASGGVNVEDWSLNRRRTSAWSPLPRSTLSRTMSEHTLDRSVRYRDTDCRDDLLDEWSIDTDRLESVLSPPRIAPVSGQLSLVCIGTEHSLTV